MSHPTPGGTPEPVLPPAPPAAGTPEPPYQAPYQQAPYQQAPYQQAPPSAPFPGSPQGPYQGAPPQGPYQGVPPQPYPGAPYPGGAHPMAQPYKDSTAAWLLWFFTGFFGGHHFYFGDNQRGVAYAVTWGVSFLLSFVIIGIVGYVVLFVLWIIDATKMSERLQQYNAQVYARNQAMGLA
jgi:TM2 domain-containing membrane protein YozV